MDLRFFSKLLSGLASFPERRSVRRAEQTSLTVERLEDRAMFAADVSLSKGVLTITGDNDLNDAVVSYSGANVRVSMTTTLASGYSLVPIVITKEFKSSSVKDIRFYGYNEDDSFTNNTSIKSTAYGGAGNDSLVGGSGIDLFYGGTGNDELIGNGGNDKLYGDAGDDDIMGRGGNDYLNGGTGEDSYYFGAGSLGADKVDDAYDKNSLNFYYFGGAVKVDLGSTSKQTVHSSYLSLTLAQSTTIDNVYGSQYDDRIVGNALNNIIYGNDGNDSLYGMSGDDTLYGGDGNDGLYGGVGDDFLKGNAGSDRFLVMIGGDEHQDAGSADAVLYFDNGTKNWTQQEIVAVDEGLALLHRRVGNDNLLELPAGGSLTFKRDAVGSKSTTLATNYGSGKISFFDGTFKKTGRAAQTAIHEIGHNWDTEHYNWSSWLALSGWSTTSATGKVKSTDGEWYHTKTASFSRTYGKTNPREDFASSFEAYFTNRYSLTNASGSKAPSTAKTAHLDALFATLD